MSALVGEKRTFSNPSPVTLIVFSLNLFGLYIIMVIMKLKKHAIIVMF